MGIHGGDEGSSTSVGVLQVLDEDVVEDVPARVLEAVRSKRRDQRLWPIRVDDELAAGVEAVLELRVQAWSTERARLEARRVSAMDLPDRPSRHAVMLGLLRVGIREALRPRGARDKGRAKGVGRPSDGGSRAGGGAGAKSGGAR